MSHVHVNTTAAVKLYNIASFHRYTVWNLYYSEDFRISIDLHHDFQQHNLCDLVDKLYVPELKCFDEKPHPVEYAWYNLSIYQVQMINYLIL